MSQYAASPPVRRSTAGDNDVHHQEYQTSVAFCLPRRRYTLRVLGRTCPAGRKTLSRPHNRCLPLALAPPSGSSRLSHGRMPVPRVPSECRLHGRNTLCPRQPCRRLSGAGHTEPDPTLRVGPLPLPSAHREDAAHRCAEAHASPTCCAGGSKMLGWPVV